MTRHQLALHLVLAATGCSAEPRQASTTPPEVTVSATATIAVPTATTVANVATAATVTASASAAPAPTISEQLSNAPARIYRALDTGAVNATRPLVTRKLQRFEEQVLLTVATQTVNNSGELTPTHLKPFGAPRIQWLVGTASTAGKQTTFDLHDAHGKLKLECEMGMVQVAAASAVRKSKRQGGCNGDRGHWVPGAMKRVEVLRCGIDRSEQDPSYAPDRLEEMAFVASPGIEFLFVNDDCVMQGGGYRFVPADGSVAAVRAPMQ